jgi:hypothetical protein
MFPHCIRCLLPLTLAHATCEHRSLEEFREPGVAHNVAQLRCDHYEDRRQGTFIEFVDSSQFAWGVRILGALTSFCLRKTASFAAGAKEDCLQSRW